MHGEIDAVPAHATMGVVNNLVMFDQHAKQNRITSVVPDLATEWSCSEDGTELTFAPSVTVLDIHFVVGPKLSATASAAASSTSLRWRETPRR